MVILFTMKSYHPKLRIMLGTNNYMYTSRIFVYILCVFPVLYNINIHVWRYIESTPNKYKNETVLSQETVLFFYAFRIQNIDTNINNINVFGVSLGNMYIVIDII